jgi:hypothetical protein
MEMRRYFITALFLLGLVATTADPGVAQSYKSSIGWNAGVLYSTSLNDGAAGGEGHVDLKPEMTWNVGAHYDHWIGGGQLGFRAQAAFARHELDWIQGPRGIYTYTGDIGVMLRPVAQTPDRTVLPFLTGGVGMILWSLGDGPPTSFSSAGASYAGDERFQLVAVGGVGFDFITPWHWDEGPIIVRLEGRDHFQFTSPFDPVNPEDPDFGLIHNIGVTLGFHTGVGWMGGGN